MYISLEDACYTPDKGTDFAEVTIPGGERVITLDNGDILTRRDSKSTITEEPVTTVILGDQVTKLEMELLPKENPKVQTKDFKDNVAEADKWYKEVYKDYDDNLNSEQIAAIQLYTTQNYKTINKGLRENTLPADKEKDVQAISEALANIPLPETVVAYRKAGKNALGLVH
ncbi:ADP-ribosyltransferase [Bacillus cereus]|uniref:ADP-ribosyltransferase n=1 Tax=Bacillus cereus TaxID=1396 RepID=UPI001F5B87A1|nr:ADP-ribosyltransferase [Bacillus cereus]